MSLYKHHLRPVIRQGLLRTWRPLQQPKRTIAVSGLPRSGTSWIAKCLSLAEGVSYYFEPDHNLGPDYYYRYCPAAVRDEVLTSHIKSSLKGQIHDEYVVAEQGLRQILQRPFNDTVLLKWVRLSLALDNIAESFPSLQIVQIVRLPVPQFLSWKQRKWDPDFNLGLLTKQSALMNGPLKTKTSILLNAETYWEKAAAFWAAVTTVQIASHRKTWILKQHEWYCLEPEARVRWLFEKLGLIWNEKVAEFLSPNRARVSGPGYGPARDPRSEINKWRGKISNSDLDEIGSVLKAFDLPIYQGLDPERFFDV